MLYQLLLAILAKIATVPFWSWEGWMPHVMAPTLLILAIYQFDIPFRGERTKPITTEYIGHGFSDKLDYSVVYGDKWTAANAITGLGIIGVVDMLYLVVSGTYQILIPFVLLWALGLSDALDGLAAKKHDCHSLWGALMDPARDRLVLAVLLLSIITQVGIGAWVVPMLFMAKFELEIARLGAETRALTGTGLSTHGPGKKRQVVHCIIVGVLFLTYFMLPVPEAYVADTTALAMFVMAVASYYAKVHYAHQFEDYQELVVKRNTTTQTYA